MNDLIKAQTKGARELVERARLGDQNAMGMLEMIGENARAGNKRAVTAFGLVKEYIQAHPVKSPIGAEANNTLGILKEPSNDIGNLLGALCALPMFGSGAVITAACIILGNGPNWTKPRVKEVDAILAGEHEKSLFRYGYTFSSDESKIKPISKKLPGEAIGYLCAGHVIGTARRIQLARLPQVPLSVLSNEVGWEVGCG